jgi:hypothetical protein
MTKKWNRKGAFMAFNNENRYSDLLLTGTDSANSHPDNQKLRGYNTHMKIGCHHLRTAASSIIVLSIIPPVKTSF